MCSHLAVFPLMLLASSLVFICDGIKQNEFEVSQIQLSFYLSIVYIICLTVFYNRPHWHWSIGSKNTGSWRVVKTTGNKEIISFVWLYFYNQYLQVLTHFAWSHHLIICIWKVFAKSCPSIDLMDKQMFVF